MILILAKVALYYFYDEHTPTAQGNILYYNQS